MENDCIYSARVIKGRHDLTDIRSAVEGDQLNLIPLIFVLRYTNLMYLLTTAFQRIQ